MIPIFSLNCLINIYSYTFVQYKLTSYAFFYYNYRSSGVFAQHPRESICKFRDKFQGGINAAFGGSVQLAMMKTFLRQKVPRYTGF
jgi:hypothetical protein